MVYVRPHIRNGRWVNGYFRRPPSRNEQSPTGIGVAILVICGLVILGLSGLGSDTDVPSPTGAARFTISEVSSSQEDECYPASYGHVQDFFRSHPCASLQRTLYKADDQEGNSVLISASRTDMSSAEDAQLLNQLADREGSGNVADLARETPGYTHIKFTGQHYRSAIDGASVRIAEAEPLSGDPSADTLRDLAQRAIEQQ